MLSSGSNVRRGSATLSSTMPPLPQCLPLEPITLGNQKCTRSGELRRVLGFPLGSTSEDHSFGVSHPKPPPSVATEELKHFKESVQDASRKSRDRAKMLRESISKLDKYRDALSTKKRQRSDLSMSDGSNGVSLVKLGTQINKNPQGIVTQRLEGRAKSVGLNKRVRTSVADVRADARSAATSRQKVVTEKDESMLQSVSVDTVKIEEKNPKMPAGSEGFDQKTKKKRSVGVASNRVVGGERDLTRATHPKLSGDSKLRSCESTVIRLKSSTGIGGSNKSDCSVESNNFSTFTVLKNEMECAGTKERSAVLEPKLVLKRNHKIKVPEDKPARSPNTLIKGKISRAPRTGSIPSLNPSTVSPSSGAFLGWEQHSCQSKVQEARVINNQKQTIPNGSSTTIAQWVGQRPHKTSRTRRTNLVSPVSNNDEAQICSQGHATSDSLARISSVGTNGSQLSSSWNNHISKSGKEIQNASSPYGLSRSEELGAGGNKFKKKGMNSGDISLTTDQKAGAYLSTIQKNKLPNHEIGDGVRRQGRSGRGPTPLLTKPGIPPMREKSENLPTKKYLEDMKLMAENNKRTGRPPMKKQKDRKALTRVQSISLSDFTGESDDDHEELYFAANSARDASSLACSGPFWKKMESIFGSLSSEDISYLKQQLSLAEELGENLSRIFGEYSVSGILRNRELPNCSGERQGNNFNQDSWKTGPLCDKFDMRKSENVTPLYQRVLSALIPEDESEDPYHQREGKNMHLQYLSDDSQCGSCNQNDVEPKDWDKLELEVESRGELHNQKNCLLDRFSCDRSCGTNTFSNRSMSNSLHSWEQWQVEDDFSHSDLGSTCEIYPGRLQSRDASTPSFPTSERQYQSMCLDDRLLLELHSIGLGPELTPDVRRGEEMINQDIRALEQGLHQQIGWKKKYLAKIDKTVQKEAAAEKGRIELVAMDQLIAMAYRKRMACRGYNGSKSAIHKVSKRAALAFLKRTLARCRKLEERGISCFSEPALQNVIFSSPTCNNITKSFDCVGSGTASNTCNQAHQTEVRGSGAVSSALGRHDSRSDNFDNGSSEALHVIVDSSAQDSSRHGDGILNLNKDKSKKREVLLSDILGSASTRLTSTLDNGIAVNEKRTERDRNLNRDNLSINSLGGNGRSSLDCSRGERKIIGKSQQNNTTHLSSQSVPNASSRKGKAGQPPSDNIHAQSSKEPDGSNNYTNLQLNEIDSMEELGPSLELNESQDLGSWLNFDEDGLQDDDCIGLEIPMDDLTGLSMLI